MNLQLGLQPPNTTRIIWHSLRDQREWASRLNEIEREWSLTERRSVDEGLRECTLQVVGKGFEYDALAAWAHNRGLFVAPIKELGQWQGFSHYDPPGNDLYRVAVARTREALNEPDRFLGYPDCCQRWFADTFPAILDPVWQWAWSGLANSEFEAGERLIDVQASPYLNPALRYSSIRFAPHIPCSIYCKESIKLGQAMRSLMKPEVAGWVHQLLSEPIEWSCYRGIAIVITKRFRIIVGSNPARQIYKVRTSTPVLTQLAYVKAPHSQSHN